MDKIVRVYIEFLIEKNKGIWLTLPANPVAIRRTFLSLGIDWRLCDTWKISKYYFLGELGLDQINEVNLDEFNYLAYRLSTFTETELKKYIAAIEHEPLHASNLKEMIDLTYNLEGYDFYENVFCMDDIAKCWFEQQEQILINCREDMQVIRDCIDFECLGTKLIHERRGSFTKKGFIFENDIDFVPKYFGDIESIPEQFKVCITCKQER